MPTATKRFIARSVKENLFTTNAYNMYSLLVVSGKKHRNADGMDMSSRHNMTLLQNLIIELRALSKMKQWLEARQSLANTTIMSERVRLRKQWSARNILRQYKDGIGNRFPDCLETDAGIFSRKRGRDWEIVADPDCPDYPPHIEDVRESERFRNLTNEQEDFVIMSKVPQLKATDIQICLQGASAVVEVHTSHSTLTYKSAPMRT
jgi:hypothetical protein